MNVRAVTKETAKLAEMSMNVMSKRALQMRVISMPTAQTTPVDIPADVKAGSGVMEHTAQVRTRCIYSHLLLTLKAFPYQWVALDTASLQALRSKMLTSVSPFILISLLMVSMHLNRGLPLGLTPSPP